MITYRCMDLLSKKLEKRLTAAAHADQDENSYGRERYPYIPLPHCNFQHRIKPLLKSGMRVIDVGCGAGDKLLAFRKLQSKLDIFGVEINPITAELAKKLAPFATVINRSAFDLDYSLYDLIYFYRPIPDSAMQARLQEHIIKTMKYGAVLVGIYAEECIYEGDKELKTFFPPLEEGWVKRPNQSYICEK